MVAHIITLQNSQPCELQSCFHCYSQYCFVFLPYVLFSFYDKKKFSSKKEQKTIDASEKVGFFASWLFLLFATPQTTIQR